ncbi:RAB11-binding protein RELCH homolog [Centruroides vittatus]|uniref:RAB11-binding protein RELCH homolog n=1 Tax=Centruroides vittatus TaxID=120091 RepID=UPI00351047D8
MAETGKKVETDTGQEGDIHELTFDRIAWKLLKDNFILTALEFHTELVEGGRELPRLRDYFSNPGNFEKQTNEVSSSPVLPRTSSIQTLDSLDFARYSDDGERQIDERVAVLEFELRKAKETIKALRANLTVVTESNSSTPEVPIDPLSVQEAVKPHEIRALNFLVYEYLLKHNYKLTSITFSDEIEDQDFEDWDDVGLNIPKPPEILYIYRNYYRHLQLWRQFRDVECQTDIHISSQNQDVQNPLEIEINNLREMIQSLVQENDSLQNQIWKLEKESEYNKNVTSSTPLITSKKLNGPVSQKNSNLELDSRIESPITFDENMKENNLQDSPSLEVAVHTEIEDKLNDLSSIEHLNDSSEQLNHIIHTVAIASSDRKLSSAFQKALQNYGSLHKFGHDNRLASEVAEIIDSSDNVVLMLARCLPHIVPNVLLAKREELIPLLLCTISLHPEAKQRDKLLNILFNLIKRPDEEQRQMILTGFVAIAQHLGPSRVEAELLPQCWEQITHRYTERRLLVAESCGVLAPYIPSEIRSSLVLSMLQQMLREDKEEIVRETATRNLSLLLAYVDDPDKFSQAMELLLTTFEDSSAGVIEVGLTVLLPTIAAWALELNRLENYLFSTIMKALETNVQLLTQRTQDENPVPSTEEQQLALLVKALQIILPFLFVSLLQSGPFNDDKSDISPSRTTTELEVDRLPVSPSQLQDPNVIIGDAHILTTLIERYDKHITEEWYKPWEIHNWITKSFLPWLMNILSFINPPRQIIVHSFVEFMHYFCHLFGKNFVKRKVKPLFLNRVKIPEEELDYGVHLKHPALADATIPVYAAGVLTVFHQDEDRKELLSFLQELLCTLSLCHAPLASIQSTILELCSSPTYHETALAMLWDGVVHTSALVRTSSGRLFEILVGVASETLLKNRIVPALVTLASDPEIEVRIATIQAFGSILEVTSQKDLLDKVHMQFQTFLDDPQYLNQHTFQIEIIRTFARVGSNIDPKYRDDFILPKLMVLAAQNNNVSNQTKKNDIAMALLEAYTALSCCFITDVVVAESVLPGLKYLLTDLQQCDPEHAETVDIMIKEFETKADINKSAENRSAIILQSSPVSMEDVKNRMTKIFATRSNASKPNIPSIFQLRKK